MFVVLILNSTYTASLSSRFTVKRLLPSITDVSELIKDQHFVGCQEGSFIVDFLKKKGFDESRIRTFTSPDDCDEALSKGSKNGGISAFFDVIPYSKLFLSKHCDKYVTAGPTYRTDGFAFVFPKGSPLVADVSRAVIELTENGKILEMEQHWVRNESGCAGLDKSVNSSTISLQSFKGLFAITGGVTAVSLLIFIACYLYKYRDFHRSISNSRITIWSKIVAMCRHFDQRDLSSLPTGTKGQSEDKLPEAGIYRYSSTESSIQPSNVPRDHQPHTHTNEITSFAPEELNNANTTTHHSGSEDISVTQHSGVVLPHLHNRVEDSV